MVKKRNNRPSFDKNRDLMVLLTTSAIFQKIVEDAREYLNIDKGGMLDDNRLKKWTTESDIRSMEQILSSTLTNQLKKINHDQEQGLVTEEMAKEQSRLLHQKQPWNFLKFTIDYVIERFKLPLHYFQPIQTYIIHGTVSHPTSNFNVGPWPIEDVKNVFDLKYLTITIYAKLTKKDLVQLCKTINGRFGQHLPRYDRIPTLDKLIELNKWNEEKIKFDEVRQTSYKMGAKEMAQNSLKSSRKRQRVYDSKRQLKKLQENRFGIE